MSEASRSEWRSAEPTPGASYKRCSTATASCWKHASGVTIAAEGFRSIAQIYAVEAEIRGIDAGQRLSARQARLASLVAAFGERLQEQRLRVSAKSRLGEKLAYLKAAIEAIAAGHRQNRIDDLLPWNFTTSS